MSTPFLGEIRMFGGNYAPRGHALCSGQLLSISQNNALFAILGTTYGGNGVTTFALPDLQGRSPMHVGSGAGLTPRVLGEKAGTENVTLVSSQIPAHAHGLNAFTSPPTVSSPAGALPGAVRSGNLYGTPGNQQTMATASIGNTGGQPHINVQPYLTITFIIALQGIFPSRN